MEQEMIKNFPEAKQAYKNKLAKLHEPLLFYRDILEKRGYSEAEMSVIADEVLDTTYYPTEYDANVIKLLMANLDIRRKKKQEI